MKNKILKAITAIATVAFLGSAEAIYLSRSVGAGTLIIMAVSIIWLVLFVKANERRLGRSEWK